MLYQTISFTPLFPGGCPFFLISSSLFPDHFLADKCLYQAKNSFILVLNYGLAWPGPVNSRVWLHLAFQAYSLTALPFCRIITAWGSFKKNPIFVGLGL